MSKGSDSLTKQVFVAYAYNLYDTRDYRKVFTSLEKAFGIKFIFADEKITNMHILQRSSATSEAQTSRSSISRPGTRT